MANSRPAVRLSQINNKMPVLSVKNQSATAKRVRIPLRNAIGRQEVKIANESCNEDPSSEIALHTEPVATHHLLKPQLTHPQIRVQSKNSTKI